MSFFILSSVLWQNVFQSDRKTIWVRKVGWNIGTSHWFVWQILMKIYGNYYFLLGSKAIRRCSSFFIHLLRYIFDVALLLCFLFSLVASSSSFSEDHFFFVVMFFKNCFCVSFPFCTMFFICWFAGFWVSRNVEIKINKSDKKLP